MLEKKPDNLRKNLAVFLVFTGTILASVLMTPSLKWHNIFQKILGEKIIEGEKEKAKVIKEKLATLVSPFSGTYGIYIYNFTTGEELGIRENEVFPAASLIKLPVFAAFYQEAERGGLSLNTKYQILNTDKVAGAGSMYYAKPGTVYTYKEMLELMGKQSDNTAFNVFVKLLGKEKIQQAIDSLGMRRTSFAKNETTPAEVGLFFRKLYQGNLVNRENREELLSYLTKTAWEERIPAGVPEGVRVSHKVGTEIGVIADGGIVFAPKPYILVIMSKDVIEKEAKELLPRISGLIYTDLGTD
ncbi:serine hydrolase [Candidatus Shapirobacteria bacterium]|nr:serine hydrolase [Candidatus Shapirobacteria bacterium]